MISSAYINHHLTGVWYLFLGNPEGVDHFDLTERGYWKSFQAMALCLPFLLAYLFVSHRVIEEFTSNSAGEFIVAPLASYVLIMGLPGYYLPWLALIAIVRPIANALGAGARFQHWVLAYNWAGLLFILLISPMTILAGAGVIGWSGLGGFVYLLQFIQILYLWFLTRVTLKLGVLDAAAVVAMDRIVFIFASAIVGILLSLTV